MGLRTMELSISKGLYTIFLTFFLFGRNIVLRAMTDVDYRIGPVFTHEPPDNVAFTNNSIFTVQCSVKGEPTPIISWIAKDGSPVTTVDGLREVFPNGTLLFYPFASEEYRPDVHAVPYRCVASNVAGTIVSRYVNVMAIVLQHYAIQVHDVTTLQGNAAIFQCNVPSFIREFIKVQSWIRNDDKIIEQSNLQEEFKYTLLPTGELFIKDVQLSSSGSSFRCQTLNLLTGEVRTSNSSGRLVVTRAESGLAPKIAFSKAEVTASELDNVVIPCVAEGNPIPEVMWYARLTDGLLLPIHFGGRMEQLGAGLLIKEAKATDTGAYVCDVKNGYGNARGETAAIIYDPLSVMIYPANQTVDIGSSAVFRCLVTGHPVNKIRWLKNGEFLQETDEELSLPLVRWSDAGSYQCFAENSHQSSQATSQLFLGDIAPEFQKVFESAILQPGSNISLKCSAIGSPSPRISWFLENIHLNKPDNDDQYVLEEYVDWNGSVVSTLHLVDVQVEDGGIYHCVTMNKMGKGEHSARINIYGPISIRPMEPVTAVTNHNVTIHCPVYGYPIDAIQWWKDGDVLPQNLRQLIYSNGTLVISEVRRGMDAGRYTCVASNSGEREEEDVEMNVLVPPKILPFTFQDQSVREGMRARLQCAVSEGDSPLSIQWYKDGQPLPHGGITNIGLTIRELDEFSSILTIRSVTPQHNGNYTCVASNVAASVSHSTELYINVAPKILPFSFQGGHLFEGVLARVSCVVYQGDLPLTITWTKDGLPIPSDTGINVHIFDEYSSILTIGEVTPKHSGNYTCSAYNHAALTTHTAELIVNVPPRFKIKPQDATISIGGSTHIHCQADGFPEPRISWMWSNEVSPGASKKKVVRDEHFHLFANGSLLISKVSDKQQGYYFCQAANDVGPSISAVAFLAVKFPAKLSVWQTNITAHYGTSLRLQCQATGDLPMNFTWTKGDVILSTTESKRFKMTELTSSNGSVNSELLVSSATTDDSAVFGCVVQNAYGVDSSVYYVTIQESPEMPSGITVDELGSRFAKISWMKPFDGHSEITSYTVEYMKDESSYPVTVSNSDTQKISETVWENVEGKEVVQTAENSTMLSDLQPASRYFLRIYASNNVGTSDPSPTVAMITKEEAPSGSAQNVTVEAISSKSLKVCWKPPLTSTWNGIIRGYWAGFKIWGSPDLATFKSIHLTNNTKEYCANITGLHKYIRYSIVVQSFNDQGRGPNSEEVMAMTAEGVPTESAQNVTCTAISSTGIKLTWYPPSVDLLNGILKGYKILVTAGTNFLDSNTTTVWNTSSPDMVIENLEIFSNYSFKVVAFTRAGDGTPTSPVTCKTKEDAPGPPSAFRAVVMAHDAVLVAWKQPLKINGILTRYHVHMKEDWQDTDESTSWWVTTDILFYEIPGLKENQKYSFWITASTTAGEGARSKIVTLVPKGPLIPSQVISFDDSIVKMWRQRINLPCKAVGFPEPERKWIFGEQPVKISPKLKILPDGSLLIKDAQGSHSGNYTCIVKNKVGNDRVRYVVQILAPPSAPTVVVNFTTRNSIHLEWTSGANNGAEIKGYVLNFREKGDNMGQIQLKSDVTNYELNDLQCGTFYELFLYAFNDIGRGDESERLNITTNGSVPLLPQEATGIEEGATSLTVHLDKVINGECPIEQYIVEYKPKYSDLWVVYGGDTQSNKRIVVIPDLQPATWYNLRLMARSTAGSATAEYEVATLGIHGGTVPPNSDMTTVLEDGRSILFYIDLRIVIPIAACIGLLLLALIIMCVCVEKKKDVTQQSPRKVQKVEKSNNSHLARRPQDRDSAMDGFTYLRRNDDPKCHKSPPVSQDLERLLNFTDGASGTYSYSDGNSICLNLRPMNEDMAPYASYHLNNRPELQTFQQQRSSAPAGEGASSTDVEDDALERTKMQLMQQLSRPRSYTPGYANILAESPSSAKKKLRQVAIPTAPVLPGSPSHRKGSQGPAYQMDISPCSVKAQLSRSSTPTSASSTPLLKHKPQIVNSNDMSLPMPPSFHKEVAGNSSDLPHPEDSLPLPPSFITDVSPLYSNVVDSKEFLNRQSSNMA